MITQTQRSCRVVGWWLAGVVLAWLSVGRLPAADVELPMLKSGTDVFTNVTIYGQTQTDLFIKHARGFGNVKISSLDNSTLRLLKLGGETPEEKAAGTVSGKAAATVATLKAKLESSSPVRIPSEADVQGLISQLRSSRNLLAGILAGAVIAYLLYCACMKLICLNAGSKPGLMIWFPVLQMFPLLRAAKMPAWWLIPPLILVAPLVWCFKITQACGKGALVAVLLILPGTNLLAFLYLAVSKGNSQPVEEVVPLQRHTMVLGEA